MKMSLKSLSGLSFLFCLAAGLFSCQKTSNNVPVLGSPLVVLTPSSASGYGGDQVSIDYSCTAAKGIKKIIIADQFLSASKKIDLDSTLASTAAAIDRNFLYTIPDSAIGGQQAILTFTIIDANGDSTSKTATVTVTGSRPSITATPVAATAAVGDSVLFTVVMKSPEKNITTLDITSEIGTGTVTNQPSFPYANLSYVSQNYYYKVPATAASGNVIQIVFTVVNNKGITKVTAANITVK